MTFKSSIHRAAVLVKSLSKEQAVKVLALLEPSQLDELSRAISNLETVDEKQESLAKKKLVEFASYRQELGGSNANQSRMERQFDFLIDIQSRMREELLAEEHPRIIAMVLSLLPIHTASATLNAFEPLQRVSILRRLCRADKISNEEMLRLSVDMKQRLQQKLALACYESDGVESASRLLSCTDVATRTGLFDELGADEKELVGQLRSRLIELDALLKLSQSDLKVLLARTDTSLWAPALVHCHAEIKHRIFDNLAPQPSAILKREIDQAARVDVITASSAQAAIVSKLLELRDANLISSSAFHARAA